MSTLASEDVLGSELQRRVTAGEHPWLVLIRVAIEHKLIERPTSIPEHPDEALAAVWLTAITGNGKKAAARASSITHELAAGRYDLIGSNLAMYLHEGVRRVDVK